MLPRRSAAAALALALLLTPGLAGCGRSGDGSSDRAAMQAAPRATPATTPRGAPATRAALPVADGTPQVLAVSVDALNPAALRRLGAQKTPTLHRLLRQGAGTLNARSQVEQTVTLPNHTSMVTGRRIAAARGGHGVTWNDDLPGRTVGRAAGERVASVFTVAHRAGVSTALFSTKTKFSLFSRSWPAAVDETTILEERDADLVRAVRADLGADRGFTFLHLGAADAAGHASGFLGPRYLAAVRRIDRLLGTILARADRRADLDDLVVVLTADHGGMAGTTSHSDASAPADYTVPFVAWGPGIARADLYDLNPDRRDPGRSRPGYAARRQPIRNGEVGNLALSLLGLRAIPGSQQDDEQDLRVR